MARTDAQIVAADVPDVWKRIRSVLMRALGPYPEARDCVARALEEEFERRT
ncbi:MAG: hypothetical protein ABSH09_34730 [Bryobacteraceae bacterium]